MSKVSETYQKRTEDEMEILGAWDGKGMVDHASLPEPVRRHLRLCGYEGRSLPVSGRVVWKESSIRFGPDKPWTGLVTQQFNSCVSPFRAAYMKTRMFGILPFEGLDLCIGGTGSMLGKLAGVINVLDVTGLEMDTSGLVTLLAEATMIPGMLLMPYISWGKAEGNMVDASMTLKGITVGGRFIFGEDGLFRSFESDDRYYANPKGGNELRPWKVECERYGETDGIKFQSVVTASWQLPEGRYEYWRGTIERVESGSGGVIFF